MNFQLTRIATLLLLCFSLMVIPSQQSHAQEDSFARATGKKLIEIGWDHPSPEYARDHIHEMEEQPFEGVVIKLPDSGGNVFQVQNWDERQKTLQDQLKVLSSIQWNKFTDNFILINAASDIDWYKDSDWEKVLSRVELCAKAAVAGRCVGIMFDPEPYGFDPWNYSTQKHASKYSYDQYSEKVYQRGRQFMNAMQGQMPAIKLLMLYQYSLFYHPVKQSSAYTWNLLLPFINGMLAEAGPQVQLIDGNEPSYYYTKSSQFFHSYWVMRQAAQKNVPKELKTKFDLRVRAAQALFVDHIFAMWDIKSISEIMTPKERALWFEQNVYYSLQSSDEYVWLYGMKLDWWKNEGLPPGIKEAITSAKTKLMHDKDLGFNMDDVFKAVRARQEEAIQDKLQRRSAKITHLSATQIPQIDGNLTEKIYQEIPWMESFVPYLSRNEGLTAQTRMFAAYDENNLYIAVRCDETVAQKKQDSDAKTNGLPWDGDFIDIGILKRGQSTGDPEATYYHFILKPSNVQWDTINVGTRSFPNEYNPKWQSATAKDSNGWSAEIVLPWKILGISNARAGLKIHANVARRSDSGKIEHSSWSQYFSGFQEPQHFGILSLN